MVDDGICDCCDGSDESKRKCPNTCKSYHPPTDIDDEGTYQGGDGSHRDAKVHAPWMNEFGASHSPMTDPS
jgi:hypothetical protein